MVVTSLFWFRNSAAAKVSVSSVSSVNSNVLNTIYYTNKIKVINISNTNTPISNNKTPIISNTSTQQVSYSKKNIAKPGIAKNNKEAKKEVAENIVKAAALKVLVTRIESTRFTPKFKKGKMKKKLKPIAIEYRALNSDHYNCPTIGLHLHYIQPMNSYASFGQQPGLGFDLEGYSANLTPNRFVGLFLGGSTSLAWMGKSPKTNIVLNTPNSDPGKTFLQNHSAELNFVVRLEFGKGDIKFYATGFAGLRGIFVSQEIQSNKNIEGFQNTSDNVYNGAMTQWGGGVGLRYHFAPQVSLDIRAMYQDADMMYVPNLKQSTYDEFTGKYSLKYNSVQPQLLCIKFGILFCIHDADVSTSYNSIYNPGVRMPVITGNGSHSRGSSNTRNVGIKTPSRGVTPKVSK